jgi:hypothetical protein
VTAFLYGLNPNNLSSPFQSSAALNKAVGGNTGNLAFCYALWRQLKIPPVKAWEAENAQIFKEGNIGVIALANQLGEHANMQYFHDSLAKHRAGLVGIGLGAQSPAKGDVIIPQGTLQWLRLLRERAPSSQPNLTLRGEYSKAVLDRYQISDNAVVLGCPTLFISPNRNLGQAIAKRWGSRIRRVAVTAGHPKWMHLQRLEKALAGLVDGYDDYIVQSPASMIDLGKHGGNTPSTEHLELFHQYLQPDQDLDFTRAWLDQHAIAFFGATHWLEHIRRFDFVIGTRIHGVMLALQMGVPAVCITHDSRTKELCDVMMIPSIFWRDFPLDIKKDQLPELLNFEPKAFDENRRMLGQKYVNFLRSNSLDCANYLSDFAK